MDQIEARVAALHLTPEVGINQVSEIDKVRKPISCQYLTKLILDVIKAPEGGTQETPTPQTTSELNHKPRCAPRSVPVRLDTGFGESSGDPSGSPNNKTTKDPYPVPITKPACGSSETQTKDPSHVPINMLIEYSSGDTTVAPSTMLTENPSSNTRDYPSSEPDVLKRDIQEAQVSLQIYPIIFILNIITSSSSTKISTLTRQ